jgi:hypothetical protein
LIKGVIKCVLASPVLNPPIHFVHELVGPPIHWQSTGKPSLGPISEQQTLRACEIINACDIKSDSQFIPNRAVARITTGD